MAWGGSEKQLINSSTVTEFDKFRIRNRINVENINSSANGISPVGKKAYN